MNHNDHEKVIVFYDGACPRCIKDRRLYQRLAGKSTHSVLWFDISNQDVHLKSLKINPVQAMSELHLLFKGKVYVELDAYILLMQRVWLLKPLAWFIGLPVIRPALAKKYHQLVQARLARTGRL